MAGRRSGDGIATSANGRKFRGGVWDNGQLVKEVKLILEKGSSTNSLYPSACPRPRPRAGAAAALTRAACGSWAAGQLHGASAAAVRGRAPDVAGAHVLACTQSRS